MVTNIDLVRAQILIAEGQPISHPEIGLGNQDDLKVNGYAIQCRVTTEDPANNFAPDNGKIEAYRSGGGFGVRLDGGNVGTGSVISRTTTPCSSRSRAGTALPRARSRRQGHPRHQ